MTSEKTAEYSFIGEDRHVSRSSRISVSESLEHHRAPSCSQMLLLFGPCHLSMVDLLTRGLATNHGLAPHEKVALKQKI